MVTARAQRRSRIEVLEEEAVRGHGGEERAVDHGRDPERGKCEQCPIASCQRVRSCAHQQPQRRGRERRERELGPRQRDEPDRSAGGEETALTPAVLEAAEREQEAEHAENAERGRLRVRQHEAEVGRPECDREHDRGGEERAERADRAAGEPVRREHDRSRQQQPQRDGRREAAAADPCEPAEHERPERPVVIGEVDVRELPVRDPRRRDEVVARVAADVPPRRPRHPEEDESRHAEHGERELVRRHASPRGTQRGGGRSSGHAASWSCPRKRSRMPAATRSATAITDWPLTFSG